MELIKKYACDALAILLFVVIAVVYFAPADLEGRILYQHDASAGRGAGQEAATYYEKHGERTRWSNSTFSGMPTYQTAPSYKSTTFLEKIVKAYHLWLPENVWFVFVYLLGFYILLRAFDFRQYLAALGAVAWAFSSYFFIIIAAGHIWKVWALAYIPPMIAGVVLAYRGKYLWGFVVTALFAAFEVNANHVQMTYYFLFVIAAMALAFFIDALRKQRLAHFAKATAVCIAAAAVGIGINLSNLYHTWQYGQESMRGKSELVKANQGDQTNSGLERSYITQWSYGIGETWTLLIPNAKGGCHNDQLSKHEASMNKCQDPQLRDFLGQWFPYWGEQPFTAGPVYVGAFILMLFVLGLFIVKGPMKWCLLGVTVLSILLSWGKHFMGLTDLFIDFMPMYAKFRTVSSILVIAEFTIPLLAVMALKQLITNTEEPATANGGTRTQRYIYVAFALTAGFCLLFAIMPTVFFNFTSERDSQMLAQYAPPEMMSQIMGALSDMRVPIFTADCWRSFFIIVVGTLLLLLYRARKLKAAYMVMAVAALSLVDMWTVNKRYLNDGMFVEKSVRETPQQMTDTDRQILEDKSLDYRVLNLAGDTFNENETSFYHKSIGGYHAAKLRRYQEMIEAYISPEMQKMMPAIANAQGDMTKVAGDSIYPVLNMLNTKYVIMPLQGGQTVPIMNPYALGNAWMVDKIEYVDNANQEIERIAKLNLRHEAVADARFKEQLGQAVEQDSVSVVKLTDYQPNQLTYDVTSGKGGVVVFSEIYYPGWTATIDGQPAELGRVNYVLRALNVKPGNHKVTLSFFPKSIDRTESVAYVSYIVLLLACCVGGFMAWKRRKQNQTTSE